MSTDFQNPRASARGAVKDIEFHALCTDSVRWIGQRIDAAVRRLR